MYTSVGAHRSYPRTLRFCLPTYLTLALYSIFIKEAGIPPLCHSQVLLHVRAASLGNHVVPASPRHYPIE